MKLLSSFLFFFFIQSIFSQSISTLKNNKMDIELNGNSGSAKIFLINSPNSNIFWNIGWQNIEEIQGTSIIPNGKKISFLGNSFQMISTFNNIYDNQNNIIGSYIQWIGFKGNTNISIQNEVFTYPKNISYGDTSFLITENDLKFSINISNWIWSSSNVDGLLIKIKLSNNYNSKLNTNKNNNQFNVKEISSYSNIGILDFPKLILLDGEINEIKNFEQNGNIIQFIIPKFISNAYYDPSFSIQSTNNEISLANKYNIWYGFIFICFIFFLI